MAHRSEGFISSYPHINSCPCPPPCSAAAGLTMTPQGCFKDLTSIHTLPVLLAEGYPFLTPQRCAALAVKAGYTWSGTRDGTQCFAGSVPPLATLRATPSLCNSHCQGNSAETCGGQQALQAYSLTAE